MRRLLGTIPLLVLVACGGGGDAPSAEAVRTSRVDLPKSYRFDPPAIAVDLGATVTWTNNDDFPHNVHLLDGSDRTVDLPIDEEGELTFEEAGTIEYECSLHPQQMRGTVTVG